MKNHILVLALSSAFTTSVFAFAPKPFIVSTTSTINENGPTFKSIIAPKVSRSSQICASTNMDLDATVVASTSSSASTSPSSPQAIGTGCSQNPDLLFAIEEATTTALASLPPNVNIDLGIVYVSSIYDGQCSPTKIIPAIIDSIREKSNNSLQKLIGCSAGGLIGSKLSSASISTVESEGEAGVTISLCVLPDTQIQTFHLLEDDIPEELSLSRLSPSAWKTAVGMSHLASKFGSGSSPIPVVDDVDDDDVDAESDPVSFMLLPSPSFQNDLDDFLKGMKMAFGPASTVFGAVSSTVSSLSRAKLFRYDVDYPDSIQALTEGCIGVAMTGDVEFKVMLAQGSKPVGGIYRVVSGQESTIGSIQLDEIATEQLQAVEDDDDDDDDSGDLEDEMNEGEIDVKKRMAAAYKKAVIPKPVLAEANYLMKTLSDDEQAYMSKFLLVGLERNIRIGKSPSEILRLAAGLGHRFTVHQVASAGMKDGSVTLPLGRVDVELGTRMRFFVKDGEFAKKEVAAIWTGYKKRLLDTSSDDKEPFNPSGCFFFPTIDRGQSLFGGKAGFESSAIAEYVPSIPAIGGFFSNGVIAAMDEDDDQVMVHGSASCYALVGSKSRRPVYSAAIISEEINQDDEKSKDNEIAELAAAAENERTLKIANDPSADSDVDKPAPRSEDGELITKRREIHAGRALTVSTVQWSVAENMAKPTSVLEGFMWDKETEVDRFRERVPLSNLLSQCRLYDMDPTKPRPRNWIGAVKAAAEQGFVIIPELKRTEPISGSLRKRYDVKKLTKQFVQGGAPALSVNCDKVLFGGVLEDITESRDATMEAISEASNEGMVAPPILASDLILYPYQLYKLRLAGADAINLVVGALTSKDILYLSKIATSLKFSVIASVTSEVQIRNILKLGSAIDAISLSNRDLETFAFDNTGAQVLNLLKCDAMMEYKEKYPDTVVLAEGRVGMIEMEDGKGGKTANIYVQALKDAGAIGAFVGGGLADIKNDLSEYIKSLAM